MKSRNSFIPTQSEPESLFAKILKPILKARFFLYRKGILRGAISSINNHVAFYFTKRIIAFYGPILEEFAQTAGLHFEKDFKNKNPLITISDECVHHVMTGRISGSYNGRDIEMYFCYEGVPSKGGFRNTSLSLRSIFNIKTSKSLPEFELIKKSDFGTLFASLFTPFFEKEEGIEFEHNIAYANDSDTHQIKQWLTPILPAFNQLKGYATLSLQNNVIQLNKFDIIDDFNTFQSYLNFITSLPS